MYQIFIEIYTSPVLDKSNTFVLFLPDSLLLVSICDDCRDGIFNLLSRLGIDSKESNPPAYVALRAGAGIFKQSMGARHRVEIGLSYRPARLHRLAEFIPWNRFLGSVNV
jgi:hypothetical protein